MPTSTHIINDWRAPGETMECKTTYGRESDGSLYVDTVNGLPFAALADWLVDELLKRENNAQGQEWEAKADDAYMARKDAQQREERAA